MRGNVAGAVGEFRLRQWILVPSLLAAFAFAPAARVALSHPACPDGAVDPRLATAVGATFGIPIGCAQTVADGGRLQVTTTGLAIYRPDGTAVFASGDQHWALTDRGLESWAGNWHNGLLPPATPSTSADTDEAESLQARDHLASVEPLTLIGVNPDLATAVIKQDSTGGMLTVHTARGCPDLAAAVGDHIFLRSDGTTQELILVRQHEACTIVPLGGATEND